VWAGEELPLAQGNFVSLTAPHPVHPSTVPAQHDQHEALLFLLVFDTGVEARDALQGPEVNVHLCLFGGGSGGRRDGATADGDVEGLEVVREVGEGEAVVRANLV